MNKKIVALIALVLLPVGATASTLFAFEILAQIPSGVLETANQLQDKSIAYWFLVLAGIAIASWTYIFKWMISQLESQRTAHTAATDKLVDYMTKDHTSLTQILDKTIDALDRTSVVLDNAIKKIG